MDFFLHFLTISLLALFPALGWIFVYRYLDNEDPEPSLGMVFALFAGIFSTFPVFGVQEIFQRFPEYDLLAYLYANLQNPLFFSLAFLLFVGFLEELSKAFLFFLVVRKYESSFNQVVDGIVYGALVGLGFAIAENIYYFAKAFEVFHYDSNFFAVFSIRSFGTMLGHSLFTGIFGFYFAQAYFSPFVAEKSKSERLWHGFGANWRSAIRLHTTFLFLLPGREVHNHTLKRNALILEGYLVAVFAHFFYNVLIKLEFFGKNWTFLIVPLLFLLAWYLWSRFFVSWSTRLVEFISVKPRAYRVRIQ